MKYAIAIAAHKPYEMPQEPCYLPLHVGKAGKQEIGFTGDDTGEHISWKNPYYCELTGLYWIWKNVHADYKGLVHYRRHFAGRQARGEKNLWKRVLTQGELEEYMQKTDILLPARRRYYIETLYSHYAHTHYGEHLDLTREIIQRKYPEYVPAFDVVMKRTWGHMFNMFVMTEEKCNAYCQWLFSILEELEDQVDYQRLDSFQARLFGRVSELLLDVWLETNQYDSCEVPVLSMEPVNWWHKGTTFLKAKFTGKKYDSSF